MSYDPITDWSRAARERLVAERGNEIRLLLDTAFTEFVETHDAGLAAFRFRDEDPVTEAVEWSVQRFMTADIDPTKLRPGSRTFRLFTEAAFWLSQREGEKGFRRALAKGRRKDADLETVRGDAAELVGAIEQHVARLAVTLRELGARTCPDLVGFWLIGARPLLDDLPDWSAPTVDVPARSPKDKSFHVADALFRFFVLFGDLLGRDESIAVRVCALTLFAPCDNAPPYRCPDSVAVEVLGLPGVREVSKRRREGLGRMIRRTVDCATDTERAAMAHVARHSLRSSLLHLYKMADDVELCRAIDSVDGDS